MKKIHNRFKNYRKQKKYIYFLGKSILFFGVTPIRTNENT